MPLLLLLMLAVPLIEIALFIQIGGRIGLWTTIAIVILTALVGSALLRHQGLSALTAARASMANQQLPITQVFDGFCLLIAGAFLLTPGFLTDAVGFLLFVPPVRAVIGRWLWTQLRARGAVHVAGFSSGGDPSGTSPHGPGSDPRNRPGGNPTVIVDGDYREVDPADPNPPRSGPPA
ncbi:MAG: FxsA family protein [Pseudomonadota bacterium]